MKSILQFAVAAAICVLGYVFLLSVMRGAPYDAGLANTDGTWRHHAAETKIH